MKVYVFQAGSRLWTFESEEGDRPRTPGWETADQCERAVYARFSDPVTIVREKPPQSDASAQTSGDTSGPRDGIPARSDEVGDGIPLDYGPVVWTPRIPLELQRIILDAMQREADRLEHRLANPPNGLSVEEEIAVRDVNRKRRGLVLTFLQEHANR